MNQKLGRVYNFGAGPAVIPESVLQQAQDELLNWQNKGVSVLEISHRHASFVERVQATKAKLAKLVDLPDSHEIIFMMGPTRAQFAAIPFNLATQSSTVGYIDSGIWSGMALKEAQKYVDHIVSVSSKEQSYQKLPSLSETDWSQVSYLHYCENETVNGIEYPIDYVFPDAPRVVDMTSNFLSRPINIAQYDLIYAGAQKNFGPAGLVVVIIKKSLLDKARDATPSVWHYQLQSEQDSLYYTPVNFSIYMAELVFDWIAEQGGLQAMSDRADSRSKRLYDYIDHSEFYRNETHVDHRSRMNVPFLLADSDRDKAFVAEAEQAGLFALKGHRFVGGMRASLYNAMPESGVDKLLEFMTNFEKR